jgi:hypothetical protein
MHLLRFIRFIMAGTTISSVLLSAGCRPPPPEPPKPLTGRYLTDSDFVRYWIDVRPDGTFSFWGSERGVGDKGHRGKWRPSANECIILDSPPGYHRCSFNEDDESVEETICCIDPSSCPFPGPFELCRVKEAPSPSGSEKNGRIIYELKPRNSSEPQRIAKMSRYDPAVDYHLKRACTGNSVSTDCHCAVERDLASLDLKTLTGHLRIDAAEPVKLQHLRGSRIESLSIYDPSLTSLDDLPPIPTLKTLFVQAPLRRLPDMSRFPALESLALDRTFLIDFRPLENSKITRLEVSSYQRISARFFGPLVNLKSLTIQSTVGISRTELEELRQQRPDIRLISRRPPIWDRWPYICGVLTPPLMQPCGWMDECPINGLCSTNEQGQCFAASDADCLQSQACIDKQKCSAQNGICIASPGQGSQQKP